MNCFVRQTPAARVVRGGQGAAQDVSQDAGVLRTLQPLQEQGDHHRREKVRATDHLKSRPFNTGHLNTFSLESMLVQKKFHNYEVAALANLCPENSEEAKALIPR